jgi:hypothetical protein
MPLVKVQSRGTQNVGGGRKNLIINGAMEVAQRGTSASSKTASDYYTCDRWRTEASGATFNTSQQSNTASDMATTGAKHFLRMEVTTANNNSGISQKIEAKNIRQFKGEKLTLSFYAKGTNPNGGSFDVVRQFDDGSASSTQEKSSLTVTSSFVKYTYTFDYPDEGSVTMTDANAKLALSFLQPDGDSSTNAWTLDITSVQLEVGEQATPFEHRSFGEELSLCERYFVECFPGDSNYESAGSGFAYVNGVAIYRPLRVQMRAKPSLSPSASGTIHVSDDVNASTNCSNIITNTGVTSRQIMYMECTANGVTTYRPYHVRANGTTTNASIQLDAEI